MPDLGGLAELPSAAGRPGWRIEIQKRGKYWQWRQGSKAQRKARYGGKFELLSNERKQAYEVNKAKREKVTA